ncbi:hypothetical protein IQ07DRAFT_496077 [Pyrenochaeta sp. DS3sAY3a]|nr:hypothetical protein IQ07DRAFT_496077 [Pyrenochaeta sp. DS3sAY3a]
MVCKGQKLLLGMTLNPEHAINFVSPLTTPFASGDFWDHLNRWGYFDDSDEGYRGNDCEMDQVYQLGRALRDVGISPESNQQGGPNRCFSVIHCNGPAVERLPDGELPPRSEQYYTVSGIRYRVTDAHFTIGVNAESGVTYLISRASPENEARMLWETDWIEKDELPALRSSSDFAWGFWTRMSPGNLGNINKFLSMTITNDATQAIIRRILFLHLGELKTNLANVPIWPGWTFTSDQAEYHALIGASMIG